MRTPLYSGHFKFVGTQFNILKSPLKEILQLGGMLAVLRGSTIIMS